MEAKVENITVENVSDDDCPKATSPSQQFPLFLIRIDNELASKAKDSLELYLLVEKIVWKLKLRISQWRMFQMMIALKQQALLCNSLCF
jgi:hypothetical protein